MVLLAPTLVLAGVLLLRMRPIGFAMGTAVSVFVAAYQINLMASGVFQANADVPGVKAFPLESIILTVGFVVASVILLLARTEGGPMKLPISQAGLSAVTGCTTPFPPSKLETFSRVVAAIRPTASWVKKAWCAVTSTFGNVSSRAKTSSLMIS